MVMELKIMKIYKLTYKSDIYSMAVTIIEVWCGEIWKDSETFNGCRNEVLYGLRIIEKEEKELSKILRKSLSLKDNERDYISCILKKYNYIINGG